jgi:4-aminobutyrate--pyruvate transaminase
MAADLEQLILDEGPETVAAFIAEPVMGAGGAVPPPATYFEKIQAVLKKYDVLFIADEVICGFMRTGNYWGSQTYDLKPDMIVCAKALSASYLPIAAIMLNEKVFQGLVRGSDDAGMFGHGYTYSGHPVACAVALETLKIYDDRNILGHVRAVAPAMLGRMHGFADHPLVGEVRGVGMVGAIELVKDKDTKEAFDPKLGVGAYLSARAQARGLILRPLGDSIAFSPPLVIDEANLHAVFDRFGAALDETHAWLAADGVV